MIYNCGIEHFWHTIKLYNYDKMPHILLYNLRRAFRFQMSAKPKVSATILLEKYLIRLPPLNFLMPYMRVTKISAAHLQIFILLRNLAH